MEFTEKGLVLKVGEFREADAWVRLLSPHRGAWTGFAFGGMKSRRRFPGCLDPLNLVLFKVSQSRTGEYQNLEEGTLLHGFTAVKADPPRLGVAVNCVKFIEAVEVGPQGGAEAFDLLLETLQALESGRAAQEATPFLFRAAVAFAQGYAPQLSDCAGCGAGLSDFDNPRFFVEKGQVFCPRCQRADKAGPGTGLAVSPSALRTLQWIRDSRPKDWKLLDLPPSVWREITQAVELFVAYHLDLRWDNGRYQKV